MSWSTLLCAAAFTPFLLASATAATFQPSFTSAAGQLQTGLFGNISGTTTYAGGVLTLTDTTDPTKVNNGIFGVTTTFGLVGNFDVKVNLAPVTSGAVTTAAWGRPTLTLTPVGPDPWSATGLQGAYVDWTYAYQELSTNWLQWETNGSGSYSSSNVSSSASSAGEPVELKRTITTVGNVTTTVIQAGWAGGTPFTIFTDTTGTNPLDGALAVSLSLNDWGGSTSPVPNAAAFSSLNITADSFVPEPPPLMTLGVALWASRKLRRQTAGQPVV